MPSSNALELARIRRISRIVVLAAYLGAALCLVGPAVVWSQPDLVRGVVAPGIGLSGRPVTLDPSALVGGFLASLLQVTVYALAFWTTARLFEAFARGDLFETSNADRLRRLGATLIVAAVATPLSRALQTFALTAGNPEGQRLVAVQIDPSTLAALFGGGAVLGFAAIMREAAVIADDHRQIV